MIKKILFSIIVVAIASVNLYAQKEKMQSILVYNFISKFVEWPAASRSGNFVIGIVGNSPINEFLTEISYVKKVGDQDIVVKKFKTASDITNCHVLIIPQSSAKEIENSVPKVGATLVISDFADGVAKGAAINFVEVNNEQKFEVKAMNASDKGLLISPILEKLAIKKY